MQLLRIYPQHSCYLYNYHISINLHEKQLYIVTLPVYVGDSTKVCLPHNKLLLRIIQILPKMKLWVYLFASLISVVGIVHGFSSTKARTRWEMGMYFET